MVVDDRAVDVTLTLFERHVKQALRLFDHPDRLGRESPLASPYVLARAMGAAARPATPRDRGAVLRDEIRAAAAGLWHGPRPTTHDEMLEAIAAARRDPDDPRYAYVVLELRCFHDFVTPNRTSDIWEHAHLLPGSKSQHYRDFDIAVKRLATLLLNRLRPTLRSERPGEPGALFGYDQQLAQLTNALAHGQTVAVVGPGGVGKTSIGASAVSRLRDHPSLWYTLRPGFNDGAGSLLFALGAFLHEHGAPNLWQYLISANGVIGDLNLAAGLLRQDLATLADRPPIICLDDLEHLSTGNLALLTPAHAQVLDVIEGLRGSTSLLLISQRALPAADLYLELDGLRIADVERLWQAAGRAVSRQEAEWLHAYTGGNPRLLTLVLALEQDDAELATLREVAGASPSLLPAFGRLWRRLVPAERRELQKLSVYQGYAPEDIIERETLEALVRLRLVERDGAGGVTLLPALAPIVHDDLSPELRETLHESAAIARLERGEYTAAAFHLAQSNQENRAVQLWFAQRQQAIARGEADAARPIFNGISRHRLDTQERKALDIIRAELRQLAGQHDEGLRELEQIDWSDESEAGARLWMLRGQMEAALGYPDQALESYGESLRVTARLLGHTVALRQCRGLLFHHGRELGASWREIYRAEVDLEVLRGLLREEEGAYDAALEAYRRILALAEQLDDESLRALAEQKIAIVHGRRQELGNAVIHARQAIAIYERLGDRAHLANMHSNLAAIYVQTRQFQAALDVGAQAYAFYVAVRDPYYAAGAAANLAEASFELGDLDGAARYAHEVLALDVRQAAPYACFTLGLIDLSRGEPAAAAAQFGESMQLARRNEDPYMVAYAQRALGQANLAAGDVNSAEQCISEALVTFRRLAIPGEISATEQLLGSVRGSLPAGMLERPL